MCKIGDYSATASWMDLSIFSCDKKWSEIKELILQWGCDIVFHA
jgi:hypothetical protein